MFDMFVLLLNELRSTEAGDAIDQIWRDQRNAATSLDISQGSVATHFKCGGIISVSTHFLLILTVK